MRSYLCLIYRAENFTMLECLWQWPFCQGGSGFPFFGETTFKYLCNEEIDKLEVIIDETPDPDSRMLVEEVCYIFVVFCCSVPCQRISWNLL